MMNILHITDLHFGRDPTEAASDERQLALDQLINTIDELDGTWRPTVICLSGDVAFGGQAGEYEFAAAWLANLMSKLKISPTNLVICPGNHDVERSIATTFARPNNPQEADQCLVTPNPDQYQRVFANFSQFCEKIGMPTYRLGELDGYLTGYRCIDGVRFVSLNSSWFCRDEGDSQRLWIGLPLLRHLEAKGQWPKQAEPCVVLLHHPREDLNPNEIHSYGNRLNTFDYICERCDILLSGHSHGEVREPDQVAGRALVFTGGAAYAGADYSNSFQVLKLSADKVQYRAFEFDPKLRSWQAAGDAKQRPIGVRSVIVSSQASEGKSLSIWKESSLAEARRIRESKSRALRPTGDLPRWIGRQVTILRIDTRSLEPNKKSLHNAGSPTWPLYQAVRRTPGRKVLLLGDLGTGKSTLLCEFVEQTLTENPNSVAFIIPASSLRLPTSPTLKELISDLTRYLNEQVGVSTFPIDLHAVLADGIELTVVVDGLDEMNLVSASKLLAQLATATEHWPTIQIVAASRPVELHGLDYSTWNVLTTLMVSQSERRLMFRNELEVAGATNDLDQRAELLDEQIAQLPAVVELLSSPLAVRLFFPRIQAGLISADVTLGDLLIDSLEERLGMWAARDSKQSITPQLDHVLPTARSKARLLGEALIAFPRDAEITREMLITRLEAAPSIVSHSSKAALANEAFETYALAGIFQGSSNLSFPVQAFREIGFAYGFAFSQTPDVIKEKGRGIWREVSFAAAICRRAGTLGDRRSEFEQYVQELLRDKTAIAASAHIVAESQDDNLAKSYIGRLRQLGSHPLNVGVEDLVGSSRVIATAIRLAGEVGFEWFFSEYLDPRYPVRFAGSAMLDAVFAEWLFEAEASLSQKQKLRLSELVRPHISAGTYQVHGIVSRLSLVVPESFSADERQFFASSLLSDPRYRERALSVIQSESGRSSDDPIVGVLGGRVWQGFGDAGLVASVLLHQHADKPPIAIIRSVLHSLSRLRSNVAIEAAIEEIKRRLGPDIWKRLLYWFTFDSDESAAASASILLHEGGIASSELIRGPMLKALHDGAYVKRAEEILSEIVCNGDEAQILWLADEIKHADEHLGGHSGWWRVFLANITRLGKNGPSTLADCVEGLGSFVLPRNAEIRQRFRELLKGEEGFAYRNALREKLDAIDPRVRRAAAAILVTTDPKGESKALRIAVQGIGEWRSHDWHEWYDLCLVLSLGPGTLTALQADLPNLGKKAQWFALRLLFRNDANIGEEHKRDLLDALLSVYSLVPAELAFVSSERQYLISSLSSSEETVGSRAAELLLQAGNLDLSVEALCWVVLSERNIFTASFEPAVKRIAEDQQFAHAVDTVGETFESNGKRPLLPMLSRAIRPNGSWKDVLWRFFMSQESISKSDHETYGLWALNYGRANPIQGAKIGSAAKALLEDPMLTNQHRGEPVQWVALLADEFTSIDASYIEKALLTGTTIEKQAACALIARLGTVPPGFVQRNRDFQIPRSTIQWDIRDRAVLLNALQDYGRPSDQIPEETCNVLAELLYCEAPSESQLDQISIEGPNGSLIASVARFCFQIDPNLDALISTMGREFSFWEQQSRCIRILVEIWRAVVTQATQQGTATRADFIIELQRHLTGHRNMVNAASELLSLGEPLPATVIPALFEDLIDNYAYRDYRLLKQLIYWVLSPLTEENRDALRQGLSRAIDLLNLKSWNSTDLGNGEPKRFLSIPLCYAVLTGEFSPASREVFYRGLKFTAAQDLTKDRRGLSEIFEHIEPLVTAIPAGLLKDLLNTGLIHSDAVVRTVAKFIFSASAPAK